MLRLAGLCPRAPFDCPMRVERVLLLGLWLVMQSEGWKTRQLSTLGGQEVLVMDDVFNTSQLQTLRSLLAATGAWFMTRPPGLVEDPPLPLPSVDELVRNPASANNHDFRWWAPVLARDMESMSLWKAMLQPALQQQLGVSRPLRVAQAVASLQRSGDRLKMEVPICGNATLQAMGQVADLVESDKGWIVYVFLNERWGADHYGELYVMDLATDDACRAPNLDSVAEIGTMVSPRFGRAVVFPASCAHLVRPSAPAMRKGQLLLRLWVTAQAQLADAANMAQAQALETRSKVREDAWNDLDDDEGSLGGSPGGVCSGQDLEPAHSIYTPQRAKSKLSKVIPAPDGSNRKVMVFDHLLTDCDAARAVRAVLAGPRNGVTFDDSEDEGNDNVVWIAGYDADDYARTRLWAAVQSVLSVASDGRKGWFPYDVSCNHLEPMDMPKRHLDCQGWEDELTVVTYINPQWQQGSGWPLEFGETTFFDGPSNTTEAFAAVRPAFGRVVVFPGTLWHAGRPPAQGMDARRFSFVSKSSPTESYARRKALREVFDVLVDSVWPRVMEVSGVGKVAEDASAALRALMLEVATEEMVGETDLTASRGHSGEEQEEEEDDEEPEPPRQQRYRSRGDDSESEEEFMSAELDAAALAYGEDEGFLDGFSGDVDADEVPEGFVEMSDEAKEALREERTRTMYGGFRGYGLRAGEFGDWSKRVHRTIKQVLLESLKQ
jgi:hypothetical protein